MKLKQITAALLLSLAGFGVGAQTDDRLYQSFGGQPGLTRLMNDFVQRLLVDPRIGSFFKKANPDRLKEQLTQQLCMVSGGPCQYQGADMASAHGEMEIGKGDFNALVEVLQQSMDAAGIPFSAQNQMLARLAPMHREIISR